VVTGRMTGRRHEALTFHLKAKQARGWHDACLVIRERYDGHGPASGPGRLAPGFAAVQHGFALHLIANRQTVHPNDTEAHHANAPMLAGLENTPRLRGFERSVRLSPFFSASFSWVNSRRSRNAAMFFPNRVRCGQFFGLRDGMPEFSRKGLKSNTRLYIVPVSCLKIRQDL